MKHSTNYYDTFIEIADDSPTHHGEVPPQKGDKLTIANIQYQMLAERPYIYTSDDLIFAVYARRKDIVESDLEEAREAYFSKGQPCLRSSPLTKRYGWGVHNDANGKIAIYGAETQAYEDFVKDDAIQKTKAMRSRRLKK